VLPCVIFEDDHVLVVNKPAGMNTHAPNPYAGEGIYEWLRHSQPRWATLAIIHRLDKETSGVVVFSKTTLANRSLTLQFTTHRVSKKYIFLTDRPGPKEESTVRSCLKRVGEKYLSRPKYASGELAETRFKPSSHRSCRAGCTLVEAEPVTGRTHQIRVHAAESGFPVLGDTLYGGSSAGRVFLHAAEIELEHPGTGKRQRFRAPEDFNSNPRLAYRAALVEPGLTTAYRVIHGTSDGWPGWFVERLGGFILSESSGPLTSLQRKELSALMDHYSALGGYHKISTRRKPTSSLVEASPQLVMGEPAPPRFVVGENGVRFELSFMEGASAGLFLDQRENRLRLLHGHIAAGFELGQAAATGLDGERSCEKANGALEVLNTFAYTCGFSICAARAGAHTVSVDLSQKYLEWGRRNFLLNRIEPGQHEFICGEVFDWLRRFRKQGRRFDVILLDPPTFSQSKQSGIFRAERDFGRLAAAALSLLKPRGVLFASSNAETWRAEQFLATVEQPIRSAGLQVLLKHYFPQPPDFPISRAEPGYLKTVWFQIANRNH